MPTTNVTPGDGPVLQDIADTMARSRKVVVVTGAGISTNCGIPDFRSENGLYSLIQAQYDAVKSMAGSDAGESGTSTPAESAVKLAKEEPVAQAIRPRRRVGRPRKERPPSLDNTHPTDSPSTSASTISSASVTFTPVTQSSVPQLSKRVSDIKGKDLFDSMVWNNHLSTSIFLTFIASLRRQIRNEVKQTTRTHKFIRQLRDGGRLVRCYTQNIDGLEAREGLEMDLARGQGARSRFSPQNIKDAGAERDRLRDIRGGPLDGGVEVVGLHGGLSQLRCGLCQKICGWEQIPSNAEGPEDGDNTTTSDESNQESSQETVVASAPSSPPTLGHNRRKLRNRSISLPPNPNPANPDINLEQQIQDSCNAEEAEEEVQGSLGSQGTQLSAEDVFLTGAAPDCPYCSAKNAKREKGGRRSLAIGRLRPDVVLYGEEHPAAHLIGPLMTYDISLSPDVLLILGTSLKVHGLKVMVREFAKAVHARGGKVVFVNRTKPPESIWGDVIDYWVEWDCDAWVEDLRKRRKELWQHRGVMVLKRAESKMKTRPDAKRPQATQDDATSGAFHYDKVHGILPKISGRAPRTSASSPKPKPMCDAGITKPARKSRPSAVRDCKLNAAYFTHKIFRDLRQFALSSPSLPPLSSISVNVNRLPPLLEKPSSSSLPYEWTSDTRWKSERQWPPLTQWSLDAPRATRSSRASPQLPTPPASDPTSAQELTPSAQRIKDLGSISAILSSPLRKRRRG